MPSIVKSGSIPTPIVILGYGGSGAGKSSLPLRAKNRFGAIYMADAEHQAQHAQGEAYPEFAYDTVDTAAQVETHIANIARKDMKYAVNGELPRVLVVDTLTVLKDESENRVYDKKSNGGENLVIFDQGMWAQSKRPIRFLNQEIQRSSGAFDLVYILARSKQEMVGNGNDAKYTGNFIPDLPKGSDYTPNLIVEIKPDHTLVIKKTKPSLEAYLKEGATMSFDKFYDALAAILQLKEKSVDTTGMNTAQVEFVTECLNGQRKFESIIATCQKFTFLVDGAQVKGTPEIAKNILKAAGMTDSKIVNAKYTGAVSAVAAGIVEA